MTDETETTNLPALLNPLAMRLNAPLSANWNKLGWPEAIEFKPNEVALMREGISEAISVSFMETDPATPRDFMAAIGIVLTLPSKAGAEGLGDATIEGYRMTCAMLPADLLMQAVQHFMTDNPGGWRPSAPKLRSVVAKEYDARMKRFRRLNEMQDRANRPAPEPVAPEPVQEYVNPANIGDALKFMRAKFAEADAKEGVNTRAVDYTQGPLVPAMPAIADASDELRAYVAARRAA